MGWFWFAAALGLLLLRWADLGGPVPAVQSALPLVGASVAVLVVLSLVGRAWPVGLAATLLLVPFAVLALPWWVGDGEPAGEDDLVVLTANLLYGRADLGDLERDVRALDVEALVLLEVTAAGERELDRSGLGDLLPHRSGMVREDAGGTLVLTADPHEGLDESPAGRFTQVPVRVESPQGPWTLLAVHPHPPALLSAGAWREDLDELARWTQERPASELLVLAGDFNASQAHPAFRDITHGLDHAHRTVGGGWVRTWPVGGRVPTFVQLDHVLSRGFTVVDAGDLELAGSDHRPVWARLGWRAD